MHNLLPERTFDRYMAKICENDQVLFGERGKQALTTEINVFRERLLKDYDYFISVSENPNVRPTTRVGCQAICHRD